MQLENIDCQNRIGQEQNEKLELTKIPLVVLGSGWIKDSPHKEGENPRLDFDAKLRVLAAGEFYLQNRANISEIVLTGSNYNSENPSNASDMKDYLLQKYPDINPETITLEERPWNTSEEAEYVKEKLKSNDSVFLITSSPHLQRATRLFKKAGFERVEKVSAEDYLKGEYAENDGRRLKTNRTKRFLKMIENYKKSKTYKKFKKREALLNISLLFDPKGKLTRFLSHRIRGNKNSS
jgi:uncharacterized SAM-binding protein YcdF (DUF218 family)